MLADKQRRRALRQRQARPPRHLNLRQPSSEARSSASAWRLWKQRRKPTLPPPEGEKADRKKHVGVIVAAVVFAVLLIGAGVAYSVLAPTVDDKQIEATGTDAVQETEVDATADADVSDDTGDGNGANAATTPAPDFTMTDADGATLTLADFKGKPVLLNFWASWCGPCASEMPDIQSAWEEHGNDVEFVIVNMTGMNGETEQSAKAFLAENNYTFPCYFDANNSAASAFGVSSIPQTYLINAEGNIIGAYMGAMDASVLAQGIDMLTGNTSAPAAQ